MSYEIKPITFDSAEIAINNNIEHQQAGELQNACRQLCDDGKINLIVNLENVTYLDSASLGVLVGIRALAKARKGQLNLTNIQPRLATILHSMKLDQVFGIELG